eukprot:symbB.v1.2.018634.t1/scaffold1495.1/size115473/1
MTAMKLTEARMSEALQLTKRSGSMAVRQRDVFLLSHLLEILPFASRRAHSRILKTKEGRQPLEVGTVCQVDTGMAFYDGIVLSQASLNLYLVADVETRTQEMKDEKWLLPYHPGERGGGDVPDFLNFARKEVVSETTQLKAYQKVGVNWLIQSFYNRCGGILADDMGLGKTLQTLAFLSYMRVSGPARTPALVVVPLSCAGNWAREAKRFVPHLSVAKVCGTVKERQRSLDDNEIWYGMKDIIITTYEALVSTEEFFQRHHWSVLVLDEAHRIKNQNSKIREIMDTIPCASRFLLTGTPLQNNLGELFALLKFLWPDVMAKESEMFDNAIRLPELRDKAADETAKAKVDHILVQKIRHILGMVMLRRRKEEVIRLPPKIFHDVWLPSTPMQVTWYKKVLHLQHLSVSRDLRVLKKLLVRLRSVAAHPRCLFANKDDRDYLVSMGITTHEEMEKFYQTEMSEEAEGFPEKPERKSLYSNHPFSAPWMKHYLSIIGNFGRLSRWRLALDTFHAFPGVPTGTTTSPRDAATLRGAVLGALCRGEQWQRALLFLQDTRLQRLQLDVISCNGLLSAISKTLPSAWPMAAEVLLEMRQGALPSPNRVSFNATIAAAARGAAWPVALGVLQDMHDFHVMSDIVTLGTSINALQHDRLWQHVLQLLRDFSEKLVQPDLRAWNGAMTCCTRAEAWRMTLQMFNHLRSDSSSVEANEVSYNAALSALERGQHWQPVLWMLEEMQQRQVRADVVSFNTSISAMQWGQQWEMALHLFESSQRRKVEPSDVTIAAVLGACGKGLQWQRSLELFWRQEVSSSCAPKEAAVVSTMAVCGQCSQWREAGKVGEILGCV